MEKKKSPKRKAMPMNIMSLYKEGAKTIKSSIKANNKRLNVTLTVDTLVLYFPADYKLENRLIDNDVKLDDYSYIISRNTGKHQYELCARFKYKNIAIGNLYMRKKSRSNYQSMNNNQFQIAKERFYSNEDWATIVNDLMCILNIQYKIHRLDIALDTDLDLLAKYEKIYKVRKGKILGKSKIPALYQDTHNVSLANVRYTIDEHKKFIVFYAKDFGAVQQTSEEDKLANSKYKTIHKYQTEYWAKNGLISTERINRLELRLFTKYAKIEGLKNLYDKELLLTIMKREINKNLTFKMKNDKEISLIDFDNLSINNKYINVLENYHFNLTPREKEHLKIWFDAKSPKVISVISADRAVIDIGDELQMEVQRNPDKQRKKYCPLLTTYHFTEEEYRRKRPGKMTKEQAKGIAAIEQLLSDNPSLAEPIADPDYDPDRLLIF